MRHPTGDEKIWSGTPSGVPADLQAAPAFSQSDEAAVPRTGWRRRGLWALLVVAALAAGWFATGYFRQGDEAIPRAGRRGEVDGPIPVLASEARRADVPVYVETVGTTRPLNTVTVRPQVDGQLMELPFQEGQDVKAGEVIARIDPRTYQAQLDQVLAKKAQDEAQLANVRRDLERFTQLLARNAGTQQAVDAQRAQVAQLEAQLKSDAAAIENATTILGYTKVTAPIDGRTGIRNVDVGNLIRAGDAGIVTITQLRPISVLFNVAQQQLPQINRGQAQGKLSVEALGADKASVIDRGTLQVVDNAVDPTTGTVRLKADFPNQNLQLWPGAFVNVRLVVETLKQAVVVPSTAIQRGPNGTFVFVLREGDAVAVRPVTVTQQGETEAVVTAGLEPGDKVVTTGFTRLAEGTKVRASAAPESPAGAGVRGSLGPEDAPAGQAGARPWGGERGSRPDRGSRPEGGRSGERRQRPDPGAAPAAQ